MDFLARYWSSLDIDKIAMDLLSKAISIAFLSFFFFVGKRVIFFIYKHTIERSIKLTKQDEARQLTLIRLFHNIIDYTLNFFYAYWILSILGVPIASLLAGAGIAGLAIGLGAQGFLTDLVNGVFILLERQLEVGDNVSLTALTVNGNVTAVGLRTTQIRDFDGTLHFIPNRNITVVSNKSRGLMRSQIDIPVFAETNFEQMTELVQDVNSLEIPKLTYTVEKVKVLGAKTNANGQLVYRVELFVENGKQNETYSHFYQLYQKAFTEAGINLPTPFPTTANKNKI